MLAITREDEFHLNYIVCFKIYTNVTLPSNSTTANDALQAATSLEVTSNTGIQSVVWSGSDCLYWSRLTLGPRTVHLQVAAPPPKPLMEWHGNHRVGH